MILKRLKLFGFMAFAIAIAMTACKDEFNEKDFLLLQNDLSREKQQRDSAYLANLNEDQAEDFIAALNEAGDLMAVTLLVREDGAPVSGVVVTFTGGEPEAPATGRTQVAVSATTGIDGNAVFDRMPIGRHTVSLTKAGYATATALVNFGNPAAPRTITTTVNGVTQTTYLAPDKRFENLTFPLFSTEASSTKTATVSGVVTIETDLTNLTPEIPQNLTLKADLSDLVNYGSLTGSVSIYGYSLNGGGLGEAIVDNTTGAFTMTLPASEDGIDGLSLIVPELQGSQRIAINGIDNGTGTVIAIPTGPEFRDIPTRWGGNASGFTIVPTVVGARAVFPEPPAAGKGFTFDFTAQPRSLTAGEINLTTNNNLGNILYKITNRGSYTSTPTATISGGGGSVTIQPEARLRAAVASITRTAAGSGYTVGIDINLVMVDDDGNEATLGTLTVAPVNEGLPATFDPASFINVENFGTNDPALNIADAASFKLTVTGNGAGATVTGVINASLDRVIISDVGSGFSSAPSITFTGGGATTQATIQVVRFPLQWNLTPNNSGNTVDYAVMPGSISLFYPATPTLDGLTNSSVDFHTSGIGTQESVNRKLTESLTVSGGDIVLLNPGITLRTTQFWPVKPEVRIVDETPSQAKASLSIANTGEVNSTVSYNSGGKGYNTPFQFTVVPAIAGAPGTGAEFIQAHTFNSASGEYTVTGATRITGGTGYLQNLNRKSFEADNIFPNGVGIPALQPGNTYTVNVTYGTGFKTINVN